MGMLEEAIKMIDGIAPLRVVGKVIEVTGITVKVSVPQVQIGDICYIKKSKENLLVKAEVVGFDQNKTILMPLGDISGIGVGNEVIPTYRPFTVKVGNELLGRILNGLGEPMDIETKGPFLSMEEYPVYNSPPNPLQRKRITRALSMGVKAIDGLLTCGEGQRMGFFAAAGVGKSTLMGMIARNTKAEVNVIGLIGERGREVNDFLEKELGEEGLKRSVVVVSTSDQPSLVRLKASYVATTIAEYFRDQGKQVILMLDSITRFARAQREVGLAAGEPPARQGFPPSVFAILPKLLERAGNSDKGSITAFYTILVEGDDMTEPIADEVRAILDGHIILTRDLASKGHYPAINVCESISRVMDNIISEKHLQAARKLREVIATYEKNKELIKIGAYEEGSDPEVDYALRKIKEVNNFLQQKVEEKISFEEEIEGLVAIFA
ncbi:MAG: flagellar protein export ATPase FliI [bacterium]